MRNKHLYPANWKEISLAVRSEANWRCECCDRPCRRPGQRWDAFVDSLTESDNDWQPETSDEFFDDETGEWGYVPKPGRFVLTVSHIDRDPANCDRANLRALCATCHLRYDIPQHVSNAAKTRSRKRDDRDRAIGQLPLIF
jgi:hypothetical protein